MSATRKRGTYASGLGWGAVSFVATTGLGVFSSIAIARVYGIDILGEFALVAAPTTLVTYLSSAREQAALSRELAALPIGDPKVTGLFAAVSAFSTALTVVVALLGLVASWFLFNGPIDQPQLFSAVAVNLAGYVAITNATWNVDVVLSSFRAGRELSAVRLGQALTFLAVAVGAGLAWESVWALVGATILSFGVSLVHRLLVLRNYMPFRAPRSAYAYGFRRLPEMVRFGLKVTPGAIADGLTTEAGTWVLALTGSVRTVGAYNRAWQLGKRFLDLNYRVTEMLFPTLIERRDARDHAGFDRVLVDSMKYVTVAMLLPAAVCGGAANAVMDLFGPGFDEAAGALAILLVVPALSSANGILNLALLADDRPGVASAGSVVRMLATFVLCYPLAEWRGPSGVALSMALAFAVHTLWLALRVQRGMSTPLHVLWPARKMLAVPAAFAAGFAISRLVDVSVGGLVGLVLALAAGTLAYAGAFVLLRGADQRDRERARKLVERLRRSPDSVQHQPPEPNSA